MTQWIAPTAAGPVTGTVRLPGSKSMTARALVLSQVFLSFGIPFALIPLVLFCRNPAIMGNLVNRRVTNWAAYGVAAVIIGLNFYLLYQAILPTA